MRRTIGFIACLLLVVGAGWLILNYQAAVDWWRASHFVPSSQVASLASETTMTDRGRELFYASEPQVLASEPFNKACTSKGEATIILGCYKMQDIYLFDVTDTRLSGVKEVTAAHEMLHAAYQRLDGDGKTKVNAMLKPVIEDMKDHRILGLVAIYNRQEPGELYNEMHSILGTEYASLTPELEAYYKQFFADRSKVVAFANRYQSIFTESQKKIDEYDKQLATLKAQIDQNNATLQRKQSELELASSELSSLRSAQHYDEYNAKVPPYNALVASFNALVEQTRQLVAEYNGAVASRNQQATAQNDLNQSLDSNYKPAAAQ